MTKLIRNALLGDAEAISEIYTPFVKNTSISFEDQAPNILEIRGRIERTQQKHPYLVAEIDGSVAGYAYATPYRARHAYQHTAEVSVYTRCAGVAADLYNALFERLRSQNTHLLVAVVTLPNDKSVAFHERMGFSHVGTLKEVGRKFDQWHDTAIYQRLLS